jgi:ribosomal protein S18 acetylase RimI-like enzyme
MLDSLIHRAKQGGLDSIHLHVDVGNRGAVNFYLRHGFKVRKTVAGFYAESFSSGIDPPDALYLVHDLGRDRQEPLPGQE